MIAEPCLVRYPLFDKTAHVPATVRERPFHLNMWI